VAQRGSALTPATQSIADNLMRKIVVTAAMDEMDAGNAADKDRMTIVDVMYNYSAVIIEAVLRHEDIQDRLESLVVSQTDADGNNIVHVAAYNSEDALLKHTILPLLESAPRHTFDATVNAVNEKGCTPLDLAIYDGNNAVAETLLRCSAQLGPVLYTSNEQYFRDKVSPEIKQLLTLLNSNPFPENEAEPTLSQDAANSKESNRQKKKKLKKRRRKRAKSKHNRKMTLKSSLSLNVSSVHYSNSDKIIIPSLRMDKLKDSDNVSRSSWSQVIKVLPSTSRTRDNSTSRHFETRLADDFFQSSTFYEMC
jgi:hypothetical protein